MPTISTPSRRFSSSHSINASGFSQPYATWISAPEKNNNTFHQRENVKVKNVSEPLINFEAVA